MKLSGPACRRLVIAALAALLLAALAACSSPAADQSDREPADATSEELTPVRVQLAWLFGGHNAGLQVAVEKGFYADEGLDVELIPGGPEANQVSGVANGSIDIGVLASPPLLMLAVSEGFPVKAFAAEGQEHPFAYISTPENPVLEPSDLVGKTIGTQSGAQVLLDATFAQHGIDPNDVEVIDVGFDTTPLADGRIDVFTGWVINPAQYAPLNYEYEALRLWDIGIRLYAHVNIASVETIQERPDVLEGYARATARGWRYARDHIDETVDIMLDLTPALNPEDERAALEAALSLMVWTPATEGDGWGAMDPAVWADQIALWDELGQFESTVPDIDDVMTLEILEATVDGRLSQG